MNEDGFLHKYFLNNSYKGLHKWVHYFDIYERHLARFRGNSAVMLEIGVGSGGSLPMWKSYLGSGAKIIGIDINPDCKKYEEENIEIFIGSQDDPDILGAIKEKYLKLDVVLDDGSHCMEHMIKTFSYLYEHVDPFGVYIVEDTHTCYSTEFGGGLKKEGSFMEFTKDCMDELNANFNELPVTRFTRSTDSICVYDSITVFERRPQGSRQAIVTAAML